MAPSKSPYDPIVSVEGMYKGSLTRLGYFFKDPKHYGEATLAVLRETAKRYDDALDDCLIQILEAKSLLENELAVNRSRRARDAAETEVAPNKRKLERDPEQSSAGIQGNETEENPAKKIKVQHTTPEAASTTQKPREETIQHAPTSGRKPVKDALVAHKGESLPIKDEIQSDESDKRDVPRAAGAESSEAQKIQITAQRQPVPENNQDSKEEASIQKEPPDDIASQDDLNFESMFADADGHDGVGQGNPDLDFDLTNLDPDNLGGSSSDPFGPASNEDIGSNLELLPGLASYANASGDEMNMLSLPPSITAAAATMATKRPTTAAAQLASLTSRDSLDIPLPEESLGDANFNDLLAEGDFGGDASLMDLDLDDEFFNL